MPALFHVSLESYLAITFLFHAFHEQVEELGAISCVKALKLPLHRNFRVGYGSGTLLSRVMASRGEPSSEQRETGLIQYKYEVGHPTAYCHFRCSDRRWHRQSFFTETARTKKKPITTDPLSTLADAFHCITTVQIRASSSIYREAWQNAPLNWTLASSMI